MSEGIGTTATLEELAALHPRQQRTHDLIPVGINPEETPYSYLCLQRTLRQSVEEMHLAPHPERPSTTP